MRALIYRQFGDPGVCSIEQIDPPMAQAGQYRVKVISAALNPKDVLVRKGRFSRFSGRRFPFGLGYDFSGRLISGPGLAPGTAVFGMLGGWIGRSMAEELVCNERELAPLPEGLDLVAASAVPLVGLTALQALRDHLQLRPGQRLWIHGASGGVGTAAVQIARCMGADILTTSSSGNREMCRSLGANEARDYKDALPLGEANAFDAIFDTFGNLGFARARRALTPTGRFVGTVPSRALILDRLRSLMPGGQQARLVVVQARRPDLDLLARWMSEGALRPVIHQVMSWRQHEEAQRILESRHARGKLVLRID